MRHLRNRWQSLFAALALPALGRSSQRPPDAIVLEADQAALRVIARINGIRTRLADLRPDDQGPRELQRLLNGNSKLPRTVVIRLPQSKILHKRVTLPVAARANLDQILGFEIERETPFARDEVYWRHRILPHSISRSHIDVDLYLVPRSFAAPLVEVLGRHGIKVSAIETGEATDAPELIPLGSPAANDWLGIDRQLMPYAFAAAVLTFFVLVTPFIIEQWVLFRAETAMESLTGTAREAATLRQSIEQAAFSAEFLKRQKSIEKSPVAILAALTDALPDDTYLTSLNIRDGKATLSGYSAAAADLIAGLAETPGFLNPSFEAPVVRSAETSLEGFTISVALSAAEGS